MGVLGLAPVEVEPVPLANLPAATPLLGDRFLLKWRPTEAEGRDEGADDLT